VKTDAIEIDAEQKAIDLRWEAAQAEFFKASSALNERRQGQDRIRKEAISAAQQLRETCDPEIAARLVAIGKESLSLQRISADLRERIMVLSGQISQLERKGAGFPIDESNKADPNVKKLDLFRSQLSEYASELANVQTRISDLNKERDELSAKQLEP